MWIQSAYVSACVGVVASVVEGSVGVAGRQTRGISEEEEATGLVFSV